MTQERESSVYVDISREGDKNYELAASISLTLLRPGCDRGCNKIDANPYLFKEKSKQIEIR